MRIKTSNLETYLNGIKKLRELNEPDADALRDELDIVWSSMDSDDRKEADLRIAYDKCRNRDGFGGYSAWRDQRVTS